MYRGFILATALVCSACTGTAVEVNTPSADARTGEMVVFLRAPIVLTRSMALSAHGRDFLYLAPVSANRQGVDAIYLWVGMASTVDRAMTRTAPLEASNLQFVLGDADLVIPLLEWHDTTPPAPKSAVPADRSLRSVLTVADYDKLVAVGPDKVALLDGTRHVGEFEIWSGSWGAWNGLADDTAVGLGVEVKVATRAR